MKWCWGRSYSFIAKCNSTSRTCQKLKYWNQPLCSQGHSDSAHPHYIHVNATSCGSALTAPPPPPPGLWLLHIFSCQSLSGFFPFPLSFHHPFHSSELKQFPRPVLLPWFQTRGENRRHWSSLKGIFQLVLSETATLQRLLRVEINTNT